MAEITPPETRRSTARSKGKGGRHGKPVPGAAGQRSRGSGERNGGGAAQPELRPQCKSTGEQSGTPSPYREVSGREVSGREVSRRDLPAHRNSAIQRNSYAAIDLGTNNCRLLIARPSGGNFTVIDAFSRVVRLGEGLAQTGRLSDEAMDRALSALKICADKLKRRNVHLARSVATEACRRASNGDDFIQRVKRETGIMLDVISAEEEARLAVLGCHILLEQGSGPAVIFDIGGGSTELVLIEQGGAIPHIVDWQSVPWGVVSLTETCGSDESSPEARRARYEEMHGRVRESFAAFADRIARARTPDLRLLGTSGTVTTLASVHLDLPQYDRKAVDGLIVPASSMREISANLSRMSPAERRQLPCIGNERADLVVAGCAILEAILDIWPAPRLGVADRGIREGILRSLISSDSDGEQARAALRRAKRAQS